jgi:hypothetical protein
VSHEPVADGLGAQERQDRSGPLDGFAAQPAFCQNAEKFYHLVGRQLIQTLFAQGRSYVPIEEIAIVVGCMFTDSHWGFVHKPPFGEGLESVTLSNDAHSKISLMTFLCQPKNGLFLRVKDPGLSTTTPCSIVAN